MTPSATGRSLRYLSDDAIEATTIPAVERIWSSNQRPTPSSLGNEKIATESWRKRNGNGRPSRRNSSSSNSNSKPLKHNNINSISSRRQRRRLQQRKQPNNTENLRAVRVHSVLVFPCLVILVAIQVTRAILVTLGSNHLR